MGFSGTASRPYEESPDGTVSCAARLLYRQRYEKSGAEPNENGVFESVSVGMHTYWADMPKKVEIFFTIGD